MFSLSVSVVDLSCIGAPNWLNKFLREWRNCSVLCATRAGCLSPAKDVKRYLSPPVLNQQRFHARCAGEDLVQQETADATWRCRACRDVATAASAVSISSGSPRRSCVQDTLGAEILDTDLKRVGLGRSLSNALPRNKRRTSRVNGPCSALSSFLEERGIVSHRRRSEPSQGGAEQAPAEEPAAASAAAAPGQDSDDDQEDEPAAPRSSRRAKNAKKAKTESKSKQPRVSISRRAPHTRTTHTAPPAASPPAAAHAVPAWLRASCSAHAANTTRRCPS